LPLLMPLSGCSDSEGTNPGDALKDAEGSGDAENDAGDSGDAEDDDVCAANPTEGVDILWVIDNSGSMCQEQKALRDNFGAFIDRLTARTTDFQIGVTTTDMAGEIDPLARPGYLQAIPQPAPGFVEGCSGDEDGPGSSNDDDFQDDGDPTNGYLPVRANLELAVSCTKNPEQWAHLLDVTDDEISCAFGRLSGEQCPDDKRLFELFPTTPAGAQPTHSTPANENPYRPIRGDDKVLSSADYVDADTGQLDVEALKADFACMSLVGTQGSPFEKGLAAGIRAVSPEMTGGAVENPTGEGAAAPNHGLLRQDANFALIFVTDENDCSDYGLFAGESAPAEATAFLNDNGDPIERSVIQTTLCGADVCAMWNNPALAATTPLITPAKLAERLRDNLSAAKGCTISEESLVVASIHGSSRRYGASYPTAAEIDEAIANQPADQQEMRSTIDAMMENPNSCENSIYREPFSIIAERATCASPSFGTAYSGDRYETFLRNFPADRVVPRIPDNDGAHMPGLICEGADGIGFTLDRIGELIAGSIVGE
jgi:hypothetical protein